MIILLWNSNGDPNRETGIICALAGAPDGLLALDIEDNLSANMRAKCKNGACSNGDSGEWGKRVHRRP